MLKRISGLALFLGMVPGAMGFSLLGPANETYQVPDIAFDLPGDIGAPKNLGEAYRWNTPVIYYACDENFVNYFGAEGVAAIDSAFAVFNQLTNVSAYSPGLTEFPLESMRVNYQAEALSLLDLKSQTMSLIAEQLGLAEPERWTWCLHNRFTTPGGQCPQNQVYDVIKRNFDPVTSSLNQVQPSSYVNGNLFTYQIFEICSGNPPLADAVEVNVDPLGNPLSAVASDGALYGNYFLGLTRDDVGGLRYLLRTNNYAVEAAGTNTVTYITNAAPQLLFTSNLTDFAQQALVNGPGALTALYPDLQIASSTPIFTNVVTTNVFFYFTNSPFLPLGTPQLVQAVALTTNVTTYWNHQFLNAYITPDNQLVSNLNIPLVPGHSRTNGIYSFVTTNVSTTACAPTDPYGSICTNISTTDVPIIGYFGDFYILPTNLCAVAIIKTQLVTAVTINGPTFVATNAPVTTNTSGEFFSQTLTYNYNQYIYVVNPVTCPQDSVGLRQGVDRIRFVRRDYDSLLGRFFYPVTNQYSLVALTNNTLTSQVVARTVNVPDFLLTAQDISPGPGAVDSPGAVARSITFDTANVGPGLAGPGVIVPGTGFIYNKVGPIYENEAPFFLNEAGQTLFFIWASFDGSTNAPIVYPNGTSIESIENQVLLQVSPAGPALPDGQLGVNYTNVFGGFSVVGGLPPYSWSLSVGSPGLPPGLVLNSATGAITGIPIQQGIYDFNLQLTDATGRFVNRAYSLTITP